MEKVLIIVGMMFLFPVSASCQGRSMNEGRSPQWYEDTLKVLMHNSITLPHDFQKLDANINFKKYLLEALEQEGSFNYPFDSLKYMSKLYSPDKRFRMFTWYVELSNGTFENYGILQVYNEKKKVYDLIILNDGKKDIQEPEYQVLKADNWYGAVYYSIIYHKQRGKEAYTLLGYDGNNKMARRKVIEVMRLNSQGVPTFGQSMFRYNKNKHKRVIFEYSARVSMSLKYEKQNAEQGKKRREMIVFDRLAPMHESLKGQYMFYMPEINVFDGFVFEDGKWKFIKDVDARNPKTKSRTKPIRWSKPE